MPSSATLKTNTRKNPRLLKESTRKMHKTITRNSTNSKDRKQLWFSKVKKQSRPVTLQFHSRNSELNFIARTNHLAAKQCLRAHKTMNRTGRKVCWRVKNSKQCWIARQITQFLALNSKRLHQTCTKAWVQTSRKGLRQQWARTTCLMKSTEPKFHISQFKTSKRTNWIKHKEL
jgi:hypothetical protein